ncbi:MAG: hypothetical protein V4537_13190 [Pseudomonadota bacterium]
MATTTRALGSVSFIFAQPFDAAPRFRAKPDNQVAQAMKQIIPVVLALVPLVAVISACVAVP